jgi:hypothetical protein
MPKALPLVPFMAWCLVKAQGKLYFPWEKSGRGVKLTTRLHVVPMSRIRGAVSPFHDVLSLKKSQGQIHLTFTCTQIIWH